MARPGSAHSSHVSRGGRVWPRGRGVGKAGGAVDAGVAHLFRNAADGRGPAGTARRAIRRQRPGVVRLDGPTGAVAVQGPSIGRGRGMIAIVMVTCNRLPLLRQTVERVLSRTSSATTRIVIWN